jgi:hypothetical protein
MPLMLFWTLINILTRFGMAAVRNRRKPKPEPMCVTCSFVHMQYAASGKRAISCTFAGGIRLITIDVMYRLPRPYCANPHTCCRICAVPARLMAV